MVHEDSPIWLELRFRGGQSIFEMRAGERPLAVGSGWCTHLRIDDAQVALVHFELERVGDSIWLVPTGSSDVRLNAAHVGLAESLPERSVIEFLEHEIEVLLHHTLPPYQPSRRERSCYEPCPPTLVPRTLRSASGNV